MHVVGTNIILWIRTLVRESKDEIAELGEVSRVGPGGVGVCVGGESCW